MNKSILNQIEALEESLDLINERMSEYTMSRDIPLDLVKRKRQIEEELKSLRSRKERLKSSGVLFSLANRDSQVDAIQSILDDQKDKGRPVICLIHGIETQGHSLLIDRLEKRVLPDFLGLTDPVLRVPLSWASVGDDVTVIEKRLLKNIAGRLQERVQPDPEIINNHFLRSTRPVLIDIYLLTEDWTEKCAARVEAFVRFWEAWPDLKPGQLLIVCVVIKYQSKGATDIDKRNEEMAQFVRAFQPTYLNRTKAVVIPLLDDIRRPPVEDWARIVVPQHIEEIVIDDLLTDIRELFYQNSSMPMELLVARLRELIETKL
jgi:hypothetical protein